MSGCPSHVGRCLLFLHFSKNEEMMVEEVRKQLDQPAMKALVEIASEKVGPHLVELARDVQPLLVP